LFGARRSIANPGIGRNDQEETRYEPRVFDGRIIQSDDIERIHKGVLDFKRIESISDPMREFIEDLWPELVHKLPPKKAHG
jgi:hypothetical protein